MTHVPSMAERSTPTSPRASALDLADVHRDVHWAGDRAIRFLGFDSSDEAARAAWVAHRTLARRLDRGSAGGRPIPVVPESLTLARSGDRESILAYGRPIATLLRPDPGSPNGTESFGFEIQLQSQTDELTRRAAVHLIHRTLRRSGIRWATAVREPERETSPMAGERPRHEPGAVPAVPTAPHERDASLGATLIRMASIALIFVLVALAARPFAVTQPITIPVAMVALVGFGAAAVGEANRRWQPRRMQAAHRAHVATADVVARPDDTNRRSRRAD